MKKLSILLVAVFVFVSLAAGQTVYAGPKSEPSLSGKVVETMNSGGYTYVLLEKSGKKTWVALPETKVVKGQQMSCQPGAEMVNFTSKTLKRTFDKIVFSAGVVK